jgi:hypothetical protein
MPCKTTTLLYNKSPAIMHNKSLALMYNKSAALLCGKSATHCTHYLTNQKCTTWKINQQKYAKMDNKNALLQKNVISF